MSNEIQKVLDIEPERLAAIAVYEKAQAPTLQMATVGGVFFTVCAFGLAGSIAAVGIAAAAGLFIAKELMTLVSIHQAGERHDFNGVLGRMPKQRRRQLMSMALEMLEADEQPAIAPAKSVDTTAVEVPNPFKAGDRLPANTVPVAVTPQDDDLDRYWDAAVDAPAAGFEDWDAAIPDETPVISLALFDQYPTMLIYGAPGSGKTTFARAIAARRAKAKHRILVLDPHANPANWPYPIAGAGMNFDEITKRIKGFEFWVKKRYEAYAKGVTEFEPLTFICDEMTNWGVRVGPAAGELVKSSLSDTRKINMGVVYIGHDRTLTALGDVKGLAQLRDSALLEVNLEAQVCPQTGKAVPTGYGYLKLPGRQPSKVRIPSLKELEAEMSGVKRQQQTAPSQDAPATDAPVTDNADRELIEKMRSLKAEHPDWGKVAIITAATGRKPGGSTEYVKAQELYEVIK